MDLSILRSWNVRFIESVKILRCVWSAPVCLLSFHPYAGIMTLFYSHRFFLEEQKMIFFSHQYPGTVRGVSKTLFASHQQSQGVRHTWHSPAMHGKHKRENARSRRCDSKWSAMCVDRGIWLMDLECTQQNEMISEWMECVFLWATQDRYCARRFVDMRRRLIRASNGGRRQVSPVTRQFARNKCLRGTTRAAILYRQIVWRKRRGAKCLHITPLSAFNTIFFIRCHGFMNNIVDDLYKM